jgi:hypothetical protein
MTARHDHPAKARRGFGVSDRGSRKRSGEDGWKREGGAGAPRARFRQPAKMRRSQVMSSGDRSAMTPPSCATMRMAPPATVQARETGEMEEKRADASPPAGAVTGSSGRMHRQPPQKPPGPIKAPSAAKAVLVSLIAGFLKNVVFSGGQSRPGGCHFLFGSQSFIADSEGMRSNKLLSGYLYNFKLLFLMWRGYSRCGQLIRGHHLRADLPGG